jgi:hypothetical protein
VRWIESAFESEGEIEVEVEVEVEVADGDGEEKGRGVVDAVLRSVLSKSIVPLLVNVRTRERVRSMPQGCVCRAGERRCVIMPRERIARPGSIIGCVFLCLLLDV